MSITVEATYEGGVLRPSQPLPFAENALVQVTVEPSRPPFWERAIALTANAPAEELDKPPIDGASELDHYLYGAPKRKQ